MDTAVILAAGRGTRMGTLTEDLPKPMLPLAGKPVLEHILDRLRAAGFTRALIVTGYRAGLIESHFSAYPIDIEFRRQDPVDGTATAALLAREFAGAGEFLLTYADVLVDRADYAGMATLPGANRDADAVLAVKWTDDPWQGAAVYEQDGRVTAIVEKPPRGASTTHWDSAGLYAFRASVFEELAEVRPSPRGEFELTTAIEQMISRGERLLAYRLLGECMHVGRPEDLDTVGKLL